LLRSAENATQDQGVRGSGEFSAKTAGRSHQGCMNTYRIAVPVACLLAATTAPAAADALDHVDDAIAAADEHGGRCKRAVFDQLLEIREMLRDGRAFRAARRIQQVRRDADRCPRSVERALSRAEGALQRERDRVRERNDDRVRERNDDRRRDEPPPRANDIPWSDYSELCLAHWVAVESSRGRISDDRHTEFTHMTGLACTNEPALSQTTYYPNGQIATTASGSWYFPNGQLARTGNNTFYYPNGQLLRTSDYTWYYPNGQLAYTTTSGWYYPNGQLAGAFESLANWARGRASKQQLAVYDHAFQSDVDAYRMYAVIRIASQVR
jgi:hypothetical protein